MQQRELNVGKIVHWQDSGWHGVNVIRAFNKTRVYYSSPDNLSEVFDSKIGYFIACNSTEPADCGYGCGEEYDFGKIMEVPVYKIPHTLPDTAPLTEGQRLRIKALKVCYSEALHAGLDRFWSPTDRDSYLAEVTEDIDRIEREDSIVRRPKKHRVNPSFSLDDNVRIKPDPRIIEDFWNLEGSITKLDSGTYHCNYWICLGNQMKKATSIHIRDWKGIWIPETLELLEGVKLNGGEASRTPVR